MAISLLPPVDPGGACALLHRDSQSRHDNHHATTGVMAAHDRGVRKRCGGLHVLIRRLRAGIPLVQHGRSYESQQPSASSRGTRRMSQPHCHEVARLGREQGLRLPNLD